VTVTAFAYPGLLSSTPSGFSVSACGEKFVFIRVKDPAFFAKNLCAFVSWWFKSHQGVPTPSKVFQAVPSRSKAFSRKKDCLFLAAPKLCEGGFALVQNLPQPKSRRTRPL
jgi:hypothetical protein